MEHIENIEDIPKSTLNIQPPNTLNDFDPKVMEAVAKAVQVEKEIDEKLPIENNDTCPINANITIGGMKRVQRGGPRRNARSAPAGLGGPDDTGSGSDISDQPSDSDRPSLKGDAAVGIITRVRAEAEKLRKSRQEALKRIAGMEGSEEDVQRQVDALMESTKLFQDPTQQEEFVEHAMNVRQGMIEARGLRPVENPAVAKQRAADIAKLKKKAKDDKTRIDAMPDGDEKEEAVAAAAASAAELQRLEAEQTRMNELAEEQRQNRYYFTLAVMSHICGALAVGYTNAAAVGFNSIGENVRFMFGADNLAQSCDGDNIFSLGYNGDCVEATKAAELMWSTIFGVIGVIAVTVYGLAIKDTNNPFMVLTSLSMYSVDSLAAIFKRMGGIKATIGAAAGTVAQVVVTRGAPVVRTVGSTITYPITRIGNICRRAFGMQVPGAQATGTGGRRYRRTKKHRRKTRGRKGKKMRKTKTKRARSSRKKQRGGQTNMTDLYSTGGKKRRKGKGKARKTRKKSKRRYGKKRGTHKH